MTENARLAAAALGRLEGLGVKDFVVCAGARNAPLATSLLAGGEKKGLRIRHHFDERAAAFFALGLAKRKGEPTAVVTTSGTAVAELLPAAVEAYYSGIPIVFVTADRPERFRGSGAPQAIEQEGIFRPYASTEIDGWNRNEPLHLNLCFEEPRAEDRVDDWEMAEAREPKPCRAGALDASLGTPCRLSRFARLPAIVSDFAKNADRLVVLLGELDEEYRPEIECFLSNLGAPVWAEATSGLRESVVLKLLDESEIAGTGPTHILRIGGVPSLRFWRDLETISEIEVMSVTKRPFSGLARESTLLPLSKPCMVGDPTLLNRHSETGRAPCSTVVTDTGERRALAELSRRISSEALVFLGNSLPIREWNSAASRDIPHPRCFASRGANGIDGQIATFLGLSENEPDSWGIFGDLTALYDLNAPALLDQMAEGSRRIVILNNGGGRIFSRLPSMAGLSEADKVVTENRHSRRFESWAAMWGMGYAAWKPGDAFPGLPGGCVVLEILITEE